MFIGLTFNRRPAGSLVDWRYLLTLNIYIYGVYYGLWETITSSGGQGTWVTSRSNAGTRGSPVRLPELNNRINREFHMLAAYNVISSLYFGLNEMALPV